MTWDLRLWFHDWTWAILQQTWCLILYLKQKKIGHLMSCFQQYFSYNTSGVVNRRSILKYFYGIFQWPFMCSIGFNQVCSFWEVFFYLSPIRLHVKTISSNGGHLIFLIQKKKKKKFCIGTFDANTCIVRVQSMQVWSYWGETFSIFSYRVLYMQGQIIL